MKKIKNTVASVKEKLLNISRQTKRDFNSILLQYFQERLLYRISISNYKNNFILKGGLLFLAYDIPLRSTKDIDLLGASISNKIEDITSIFKEIISIKVSDGVEFITENMLIQNIKTSDKYFDGVRVKIEAHLGDAKKFMQIDIGFGDKIVPASVEKDFPVLLDLPVPKINVYSKESVISEKFHSISELGFLNSRIKDFYDILYLASIEVFKLSVLREAIFTTFDRRKTDIANKEIIFSEKFKNDPQKQEQWKAFLFKHKLPSPYNRFSDVVNNLELFLNEVCNKKSSSELLWDNKQWKWK